MSEAKHTDKLEALLEAAVDAIITINAKGIIESVNQSAVKLFGYDRDEFIGRNVSFLMPEPWSSEHDRYLQAYQATGTKKIIGIGREVQGLKQDGSIFPMHLAVSEYEVASETFYTGIIHDLTSRKRTEDALSRSQKMEAIGQLTGGIAHDFNNLLTIITGNLELLDMRIEDERQRELLNEAQEAAELGADLTGRLLAFARRSVLAPETLNLNSLVKNMKNMLVRALGENIAVETSLDNELWNTSVDPGQIESVLLNLAVNARDAMPGGGRLLLETKNVEFDNGYVENEIGLEAGEYVCISVSDTGEGMTEFVRQNAFEPFFTTKETGRGTGLGLSMVYGFAKQSGGHATIYSELGLGSTINLYLPKFDSHEKEAKNGMKESGEVPTGSGELVLVVEDDPRVQNITVQRVESLQYKVLVANNGDEAITLLASNAEIDLVFTDLVMPGTTSGYDLVQHVNETYPNISALMTSGYAEDLIGDASLQSLNVRLLRKPYRQSALANMLHQALLEKRSDDG